MKCFQVFDGKVLIIDDEKRYIDTIANYVLDGGFVTDNDNIIYDDRQRKCVVNGKFNKYPNMKYDNIINSIDNYIAAKTEREYVAPPALTEAEIRQQLTDAVQNHMDITVQQRNYDNINSACTYASSTDSIFAAEGLACVKWRDEVWRKCYDMLAEVKAGTRAIPTAEEVIAELPTLEW